MAASGVFAHARWAHRMARIMWTWNGHQAIMPFEFRGIIREEERATIFVQESSTRFILFDIKTVINDFCLCEEIDLWTTINGAIR
ncbi:MAG: hypothetical protein D6723_09485 [Acidobacteria bacterium]|nr:MAG: hypothetical protein D6723_09485 [Acidobacteriota bacterium]